jgi:hypothetical protein
LLQRYTFFNSRRKPELLSPETYSLLNYNEAERIVADYNALAHTADSLYATLPAGLRDAYYQLVLYPVLACANLNELYYTVARNRLYASQGRGEANDLADKAAALYLRDSMLTKYYNDTLAGGKWRHMMDQTHIGYTYWQQPPFNTMPDVVRLPPEKIAAWGIAVEGSAASWPKDTGAAVLPPFDKYGAPAHYVEYFSASPPFKITSGAPWLHISPANTDTGTHANSNGRIQVSVDWKKVPPGKHRIPLLITGPDGRQVTVTAIINDPSGYANATNTGAGMFLEGDGYVSMEAALYTHAVSSTAVKWQRIPGLGRTLSGMEAMPVTAPAQTPGAGPRLEYTMYLLDQGRYNVYAYCSPTLNFNGKGLRYAISFDDEAPQVIDLAKNSFGKNWETSVANNTFSSLSTHVLSRPGKHVLKFWLVDPGVVLQKIVVDAGGMKPSYLGPPVSRFKAR